jgi:dTDP-4-dehydrorhamnose 3,5-epimerase
MTISFEITEISEIKIIQGKRFYDGRGFFTETYKEEDFLSVGIPRFVQDNLSESKKGVIRGLHWQESPFGQGKLVSCLQGSIIDIAVDIRKDSPTFGQHVRIPLTSMDAMAIWIPDGFAHGFQALQDNTIVHYKTTQTWRSESERSLNFRDPDLAIRWELIDFVVSEKDLVAPFLKDIK